MDLFSDSVPGGELYDGIPYVGLSAIGAELEIIVLKGLMDLSHKWLWHKKRSTPDAGFKLNSPDLLLSEDPCKIFGADLMSQFSCIFGTGLYAGAATNALIMGVVEYAKVAYIIGFKSTRWAV